MSTSRRVTATALVLLALVSLGGCESMDELDAWLRKNQDKVRMVGLGALGGAVAGGVLGGSQLAIGIGTGVGAVIGWKAADYIFPKDEAPLSDALRKAAAAPTGTTIEWSNPETGSKGALTPVDDAVKGANGSSCRTVESRVESSKGSTIEQQTLCRDADGNPVTAS